MNDNSQNSAAKVLKNQNVSEKALKLLGVTRTQYEASLASNKDIPQNNEMPSKAAKVLGIPKRNVQS